MIISPAEILKASSSSGVGVSYWTNFLNCARKVQLSQEFPSLNQINKQDKLNMSHVGIFFHKLRELWRLGKIGLMEAEAFTDLINHEPLFIEFGDAFEPAEWKEACRLFRAYVNGCGVEGEKGYHPGFSLQEWTTLSCEEPFEFGCRECAQRTGKCEERIQRPLGLYLCPKAFSCAQTFGVPCISGRFDEVCEIFENQREHLITSRAISIFEPGVYLVDAKTSGQRWGNIDVQYDHSLQFALYQMAWDLKYPDRPCKGMIADGVWAYKTAPRFESFLITNTEHKRALVKSYLGKCWQAFLANGFGTNPARCFDYGGTCYWLESGRCDRT